VLLLDDFGPAAMSEQEKRYLLDAVEERYVSGITVVTAQLAATGTSTSAAVVWLMPSSIDSSTTRIGSSCAPRNPC
jgi:hypothetical protein